MTGLEFWHACNSNHAFLEHSPKQASTYNRYSAIKSGGTVDKGRKWTSEVLIHLYLDFIKKELPLDACKLILLKGLEGAHDSLGTGNAKKVVNGIGLSQRKQGLPMRQDAPAEIVRQYSHTGGMLPSTLTFTKFAKAVLNDAIDIDGYTSFAELCKAGPHARALKLMQSEFRVREGHELASHEKLSVPGLRSAQAEANYVIGYIGKVNTGKLETSHPTLGIDEQQKLLWSYAVANGYVKSVKLDEKRLKADFVEAARLRNVRRPGTDVVLPGDCESHPLKDMLEILPESYVAFQKSKPPSKKKKKTAPGTPGTPTVPVPDPGDIASPPRKVGTPQVYQPLVGDGSQRNPIELEEQEEFDEELAAQYEQLKLDNAAKEKASKQRKADEDKRKRQLEEDHQVIEDRKKAKREERKRRKLEEATATETLVENPETPQGPKGAGGKPEQENLESRLQLSTPLTSRLRPRRNISYTGKATGKPKTKEPKSRRGSNKGKAT